MSTWSATGIGMAVGCFLLVVVVGFCLYWLVRDSADDNRTSMVTPPKLTKAQARLQNRRWQDGAMRRIGRED